MMRIPMLTIWAEVCVGEWVWGTFLLKWQASQRIADPYIFVVLGRPSQRCTFFVSSVTCNCPPCQPSTHMAMDGEQDPGLPTQSIWDIPFEDLVFKETIGKGSFGSVFKGNYLGVDVAIKKIEKADDPEYLKYIDREVSMLQYVLVTFLLFPCMLLWLQPCFLLLFLILYLFRSIRHPFIVQFSGMAVVGFHNMIISEIDRWC